MESINVVIDDYNDFAEVFEEDEIVSLIEEAKTQVQSDNITQNVAISTVWDVVKIDELGTKATTSSAIEIETGTFDIINPI